MTGFLTLEDVNTAKFNGVNCIHTLDTGVIGTDEFTNLKLDFAIVSHSISGNNHTFTFQIDNTDWTGGYWFSKQDNTYIDSDAEIDEDEIIITFSTNESSVKLHLYLCSFATSTEFMRLEYVFEDMDMMIITRKDLNTLEKFYYRSLKDNSRRYTNDKLIEGVLEWHS